MNAWRPLPSTNDWDTGEEIPACVSSQHATSATSNLHNDDFSSDEPGSSYNATISHHDEHNTQSKAKDRHQGLLSEFDKLDLETQGRVLKAFKDALNIESRQRTQTDSKPENSGPATSSGDTPRTDPAIWSWNDDIEATSRRNTASCTNLSSASPVDVQIHHLPNVDNAQRLTRGSVVSRPGTSSLAENIDSEEIRPSAYSLCCSSSDLFNLRPSPNDPHKATRPSMLANKSTVQAQFTYHAHYSMASTDSNISSGSIFTAPPSMRTSIDTSRTSMSSISRPPSLTFRTALANSTFKEPTMSIGGEPPQRKQQELPIEEERVEEPSRQGLPTSRVSCRCGATFERKQRKRHDDAHCPLNREQQKANLYTCYECFKLCNMGCRPPLVHSRHKIYQSVRRSKVMDHLQTYHRLPRPDSLDESWKGHFGWINPPRGVAGELISEGHQTQGRNETTVGQSKEQEEHVPPAVKTPEIAGYVNTHAHQPENKHKGRVRNTMKRLVRNSWESKAEDDGKKHKAGDLNDSQRDLFGGLYTAEDDA